MTSDITLNWREQKAAWRMIRDGESALSARVDAGIVDDAEWEACELKLAAIGLIGRLSQGGEGRDDL